VRHGCKDQRGPHHLTVDGVPVCASELVSGLDPPPVCEHYDLHTALRKAKRLRRQLPDSVIDVVTGRCPQPDTAAEFDDGWDA
jgi:hypothetical protein